MPSYATYVVNLSDHGVQTNFMDASTAEPAARLAQAMAQQGYDPAFAQAGTSYASNWHQLAGAGAAGWTATLNCLPFLDRQALDSSSGGRLFAYWFAKENPGAPIDLFAIYGWIVHRPVRPGVIMAGPDLSRASVLGFIHNIHTFEGGGLISPTDVGNRAYSSCAVVLQATPCGYKQLLPSKPGAFACNVSRATVIDTPNTPS